MPLIAYNSSVNSAQTIALGPSSIVVVGALGYVYNTNGADLFRASDTARFTVAGTIAASGTAILSGAAATPGTLAVQITQSGIIAANTPLISYGGQLDLVNHGVIDGANRAVQLLSGGAEIVNAGTISAAVNTIESAEARDWGVTITNSGEITVTTGSFAVYLNENADADDQVINSGAIHGTVRLGGGNDWYDGRSGGRVLGQIDGEAGDDSFFPGAADEVFLGGDGTDSLVFRGTSAVAIALDYSFEADGAAATDLWAEIENVIGSGRADHIRGDAGKNSLEGWAGADTIDGARGADRITGGAGKDRLTGGAGNDTFVYNTLNDNGDRITDFVSVSQNQNDRFQFSLYAFGAGMEAGVLGSSHFRARTDNKAQDRDDHFIFRTKDTTLWFDADGKGGDGPVLVADLQAGATVTAKDIFLV
ncbi:calcium-binding protein [Gemmobacter lutimaris]|nr:calcium-binding protein [Gemmobacter lutimaris]